jgi:cobalt-zinc-cadmium efflux system membrane fusion protein
MNLFFQTFVQAIRRQLPHGVSPVAVQSTRPEAGFRLVLFALLTAGLLVFAGCHRAALDLADAAPKVDGDTVIYTPDAPQRTALVAAAVQPEASARMHFSGRLVWDEDVTVRIYSPVTGRVRSVDAKPGDEVAAGTALARIDSPDVDQALADARKAEADFTLAERTLTRAQDLYAHGALARKEVDNAEDAQAGADAERQRARSKLALYNATPGAADATYALRTPLAGVVVEKNLNPGQEVRPDLILANVPQATNAPFVVTDPHRLWVLLDATELDIAALQPNQPLRIMSRAYPGRVFRGHIDLVGASLDPATRTLKVRGEVENPDLLLKAEMYADVETEKAEPAGAVAVAAQAVFLKDNQAYVYVETAPGHYTRRAIQTGTEADGRILVHAGLQPKDRVIIEGALLLEAVRTGGGAS